jgi:hypothetical protein
MAVNDVNGGGPPTRPGMKKPMKKSTKTWLIVGLVGAAGITIYFVMRARQNSASATSATDPNIDPSTGIPYSQEYGGYGASGLGGTPSLYGYYDPNTGQFITGVGSTGSGGVVTAPSSNAEWAQQVEAYLSNLGYNPMTVAAAIGRYLAGLPLTANARAIVEAALGFYGNPPQGAPPIKSQGGGGGGQGGGGNGGGGHHKQGGGGTGPPHHTIRHITIGGPHATKDLYQIAKQYGITEQRLLALNPFLKKYEGTKHPIPKRTRIRV